MKRLFAIDLRSLAAFRIGLALILLADLIDRARDLTAHYSDFGVLPRWGMLSQLSNYWQVSFHTMSGSPFVVSLLFIAAASCAVMLLVGYKTRTATVLSWAFLLSLQHRNWYVVYGGDLFLRMMLFWAIFLPLGARLSVDSLRGRVPSEALGMREIVSAGSAALLLQVFMVYFFTGLLKWKDPSWHDGSGVYYALALDMHATRLGIWLRHFPDVTRWLTHTTLWFELIGPVLLFFPFANAAFRLAMIAAFCFFQAGLGVCLRLDLFPWISAMAMLPFLPGCFWDFCGWKYSGSTEGLPRPRRSLLFFHWREWLCGFLLVYVLYWNVGTIIRVPFSGNQRLWVVGHLLGLGQGWVMFMSPRVADGWFVIPGKLADGSEVDLFKDGAPVSWVRPEVISKTFKNLRWIKYESNLWDVPALRPFYAWYLCHDWNERHPAPKRLEEFEMFFMLEKTLPNDPAPPAEKTALGHYMCSSDIAPGSP